MPGLYSTMNQQSVVKLPTAALLLGLQLPNGSNIYLVLLVNAYR